MRKPRWYAGGLGYSLRRYYIDSFYARSARDLPEKSFILDLGGTKVRKRGQFDIGRFPVNVVYANLSTAKQPDVQADAERLPFCGASFDGVICSELLEHVPSPRAVLDEISRVLKPGGKLLLCVPFLYPIHADPHDFGRYTDSFWRSQLVQAGLAIESIERQGMYWSVCADFFRAYVSEGFSEKRLAQLAKMAWFPFVQLFKAFAVWRDGKPSVKENAALRNFTTGFGIVAVRNPEVLEAFTDDCRAAGIMNVSIAGDG